MSVLVEVSGDANEAFAELFTLCDERPPNERVWMLHDDPNRGSEWEVLPDYRFSCHIWKNCSGMIHHVGYGATPGAAIQRAVHVARLRGFPE